MAAALTSAPVEAATEHWLLQFAPLLPPDPRAMKRFINDYSILRAVRTLEGNAVGMAPLALWAIIETRWPSLADLLCRHPEAISAGRDAETEPDARQPIDGVPDDLLRLLADPEFRALASFHLGGPLTAGLIA